MTTALVQRSVDFYGDELVVIHQDGVDYTPLKPVCDRFGIDWEGQRQRIARDEVLDSATCMIKAQIPGDDQRRDHICLPLDYLNGWLFGVDVGRIRPSLRERLILYKRECYRALARAFGASGDGAAPLARVVALEARVAVLERAQRARSHDNGPRRLMNCAPRLPFVLVIEEILQALRDLGGEADMYRLRLALPHLGYNGLRGKLHRMVRKNLVRRTYPGHYALP